MIKVISEYSNKKLISIIENKSDYQNEFYENCSLELNKRNLSKENILDIAAEIFKIKVKNALHDKKYLEGDDFLVFHSFFLTKTQKNKISKEEILEHKTRQHSFRYEQEE